MELIVGALVVLGFLAILTRLVPRDAAGRAMLPRIVDGSIGMWALRRLTGRRLWERPWDDDPADPHRTPPGATEDRWAASADEGVAGLNDLPIGPTPVAPIRYVVSSSQAHRIDPVSPVFTPPANRRDQARRRGLAGLGSRLAAITALAAALVVGVVVFGGVLAPRSNPLAGEVLSATGRPEETPSGAEIDPGASGGSSTGIVGSAEPTAAAPSVGGLSNGSPTPLASGPGGEATPTPRATTRPTPSIDPSPSVDPTTSPSPSPSVDPTPSIDPSPSVDPSVPA